MKNKDWLKRFANLLKIALLEID